MPDSSTEAQQKSLQSSKLKSKKGGEAANAQQRICKPKKGMNETPSRCEEGVSLTEVDQKQESKMQQVWVWGHSGIKILCVRRDVKS
jgi:hypothetical protein